MDPVVPTKESKEPITMTTSDEIIFHRRVRLLELAQELGNISAACRQLGVSRTRFYEWKKLAENYGIEALWPKDRRRPAQPNETPTHVIADLMALVVIEPTIGCRQFADRLTSSASRSPSRPCSGSWSTTDWAGAANESLEQPRSRCCPG